MFNWTNQVILLTGGTGSFGQAFTRYLLKKNPPKVLRIYSRDEYKQFQMQQDLDFKNHPKLRFFIGDVRDKDRLDRAMHDVSLVIHAAALKHILAGEYNPDEVIKTNIIGSLNILNSAIDHGVKRVFSLTTDKAVSPINLYGATKLCAEKLLIQGNSFTGKRNTIISCARYGNVAGSRGSVIPLFLMQKKQGCLTVTHKNTTRFWITIDEGIKFVIQCIQLMQGGEIFIPKMPSFKIMDLVKVIAPKAKIKFIGLRRGEKLHEDLITTHEAKNVLQCKNFYLIKPDFAFWEEVNKKTFICGEKVSSNFSYNSYFNTSYLTRLELEKKLKKLGFIN